MKRILHYAALPVWLALATVQASLDQPMVETPEVTLAYAQAGDPGAQYNYALRCHKGEGVKADLA